RRAAGAAPAGPALRRRPARDRGCGGRAGRRRPDAGDPAPVHEFRQANLRHAPRHGRFSDERVQRTRLAQATRRRACHGDPPAAALFTVSLPLLMRARDAAGRVHRHRAINEVSLFRQSYQAARLRVFVDGKERLAELVADGIMLATPAGSTAYNLSVQGPIIPIGAPLLALTPISPFRPRRWHGALLPDRARVSIEVLEPSKRPVAAVADHDEVRSVRAVEIHMDHAAAMHMLFDPGHSLDERIISEQFGH